MPHADGHVKPMLLAAEPQLFTTDLAASIAFYTGRLGFKTRFSYGDPPFYAQVARDGVSLNLRALDQLPPTRAEDDLLAASITVDDIEALNAEFQANATPLQQPLKTELWGARTFIVRDPDGNLILFAGA